MNLKKSVLYPVLVFAGLYQGVLIAEKTETEEATDCYTAVKQEFRVNDSIKIQNVNGYEYSGILDKIKTDSLVIRYTAGKYFKSNSFYRQSFFIDEIKTIDLKGYRELHTKRIFYSKAVIIGAGIYAGKVIAESEPGGLDKDPDKFNFGRFFLVITGSVLISELVGKNLSKKIPVQLSIQCK